MNILVANDDGINAQGIRHLAEAAAEFGNVWVVAPDEQCSAMSHRITVFEPLAVKEVNYGDGIKAFSVKGTPADCVKLGIDYILPVKPDIVFSGINMGYNTGIDILYSGTVGAAMEALIHGIPAAAFSVEMNGVFDTVDAHINEIIRFVLENKAAMNEIWNINFPGCQADECKGIIKGVHPARQEFYSANYKKETEPDGSVKYISAGIPVTDGEPGTDIKAVLDRYIAIGKIRNTIL